jgi:hypothetical protein
MGLLEDRMTFEELQEAYEELLQRYAAAETIWTWEGSEDIGNELRALQREVHELSKKYLGKPGPRIQGAQTDQEWRDDVGDHAT